MSTRKVVLAYSGGLDTSVAIRWLKDKGWDVVAFTVDLGEKKDLDAIQARALKTGASAAYVADGRAPFLELFVWPSLQAGAVYEKEYPLATALGRPLIAAMMVEIARREGATAIAHGCTGKGNDQVRFDVTTAALAPDLQVVAPVREWDAPMEAMSVPPGRPDSFEDLLLRAGRGDALLLFDPAGADGVGYTGRRRRFLNRWVAATLCLR